MNLTNQSDGHAGTTTWTFTITDLEISSAEVGVEEDSSDKSFFIQPVATVSDVLKGLYLIARRVERATEANARGSND